MALTCAERAARYRTTHKEECAERTRQWILKNKEKYRLMKRNNALKKYGLTNETFDDLLAEQGFQCAICPRQQSGSLKNWHVDHCHKTKVVRGILCAHCNRLLGAAGDSAIILQKAIDYLQRPPVGKIQDHLPFFKRRENKTRVPLPEIMSAESPP